MDISFEDKVYEYIIPAIARNNKSKIPQDRIIHELVDFYDKEKISIKDHFEESIFLNQDKYFYYTAVLVKKSEELFPPKD